MSDMNLLEKKVRFSAAYSTLNMLRHILQERENAEISDNQRTILLEALDILTNEGEEQKKKILQYSFHNLGDFQKSAIIQLINVLSNVAENKDDDYFLQLNSVLREQRKEYDKDKLINFVEEAMELINSEESSSQEENLISYKGL